jgi:hypothetical protein
MTVCGHGSSRPEVPLDYSTAVRARATTRLAAATRHAYGSGPALTHQSYMSAYVPVVEIPAEMMRSWSLLQT